MLLLSELERHCQPFEKAGLVIPSFEHRAPKSPDSHPRKAGTVTQKPGTIRSSRRGAQLRFFSDVGGAGF